jgi:SAM-dependent methyltransferase
VEAPLFQKDYWERKSLEERRAPDHPVVRDYVTPKIAWIQKFVPMAPSARLLDVGCGNGFFSYYFDRICQTVGIDYSSQMLSRNPIRQKFQMDAGCLAFSDVSFDVVFCHALLHHVENMDSILKEMKRVSRKYVVVLEPNPVNPLMFLFSAWVPEERKALSFSPAYLKEKIENAGLILVASCSHGMIVPNKAPAFLLPFLRLFNFPNPWGMTHILIAQRKTPDF